MTLPAHAWGAKGHRIVGEIAWQHLSPPARAQVRQLLAFAEGHEAETLAEAATWADRVRSDPSYDWAKPMHYINAPEGTLDIDLERDCPEHGCVVRAIEEFTAVFADYGASLKERREALKWVAHFVGDVHQPLHASYAADRGGNRLLVTFFGEAVNLHYLWDNALIDRYLGGWWKLRKWEGWAKKLDRLTTDTERAVWSTSTPLDWAQESYDLARSHAYAAKAGDDLAEPYYRRNLPIVERRLRQAGVRLAALLNKALEEAHRRPRPAS